MVVLSLLALVASVPSCARPRAETRRLPAWVFEASRNERPAGAVTSSRPRGGLRGRSDASDLVVAALQDGGFHFGTDGEVGSLWGYLRSGHQSVSPFDSRRGDVLFFDTRPHPGVPAPSGCDQPDHVAIVNGNDGNGRISFFEARAGRVHQSYVTPRHPHLRRDHAGRVANSFLRPKRIDDPPDTPSYAGEMLCAAIRP